MAEIERILREARTKTTAHLQISSHILQLQCVGTAGTVVACGSYDLMLYIFT